ncbi:hypothetical protein DBP19_36785 [Streptomyces sp. CS090A]|nr:hypothetical protein DBP19_36785 [Streptomyces sp. CS090A]
MRSCRWGGHGGRPQSRSRWAEWSGRGGGGRAGQGSRPGGSEVPAGRGRAGLQGCRSRPGGGCADCGGRWCSRG